VRAHLAGHDDGVVKVAPVLERVGNFRITVTVYLSPAPCHFRSWHASHAWLSPVFRTT